MLNKAVIQILFLGVRFSSEDESYLRVLVATHFNRFLEFNSSRVSAQKALYRKSGIFRETEWATSLKLVFWLGCTFFELHCEALSYILYILSFRRYSDYQFC